MLVTSKEYAEMIGVSYGTVRAAISRGRIESVLVDGRRMIDSDTPWRSQAHIGAYKGISNTRIYNIWCMMKQRCYNPHARRYERYGGRGITVCDEWRNDVESFYSWAMENGYRDDLTIDRIDNDGNYCPKNCRWATQKEQAANRTDGSVTRKKTEKIKSLKEVIGWFEEDPSMKKAFKVDVDEWIREKKKWIAENS